MDNAIEAYIEHHRAGKSHPLCVERKSYSVMLDMLLNRDDLNLAGFNKAHKDGRIRINGILILAFEIR